MRWRCGPSPFVVSSSDAHLSTSGAPAEPGNRINVFPGRLWQTLVWCSRDASRTDLLRVHTSDALPGAARWMTSISDQPSLVLLPQHRRCLTNQTHISQNIRADKWGLKKKWLQTALCSAVRSRTQISAGNLVCESLSRRDLSFDLHVCSPSTARVCLQSTQMSSVDTGRRCRSAWIFSAGSGTSMRWAGFTIAEVRRSAMGSPRGRGRARATFTGSLEVYFHQVVASLNNKLSTNSSHHLLERFVFSWSVSPH